MSEQRGTHAPNREQDRERRRVRERERRQSLTSTQRTSHLARRRATYHENQSRLELNENGRDPDTQLEDSNMMQNTFEHVPTRIDGQFMRENDRLRLTHIRRLARSNMFLQATHQNEASTSHSTVMLSSNLNPTIGQNQAAGICNPNEITMEQDNNIDIQEDNSIAPGPSRLGRRALHNSARDFHESIGLCRYRLPTPSTCTHCNARLFRHETSAMCCSNGKIVLSTPPAPIEMINLFTDQTIVGRHFIQKIRSYNHVFAVTSMGVHVDENLASARRGVYTFRAQGVIYHKIGSLIPSETNRPRFLQMYIYDTEHEVENRLLENASLDRSIIEKIQHILNVHNPYVHTLRQLAQRPDIQNCRLMIKEQPSDRRQYTMPSASQVAAIIVGGEEMENSSGREIIVETFSGQLKTVQDIAGYYDSMQYPLLLPYGTYGWDTTTQSENGESVTCCD